MSGSGTGMIYGLRANAADGNGTSRYFFIHQAFFKSTFGVGEASGAEGDGEGDGEGLFLWWCFIAGEASGFEAGVVSPVFSATGGGLPCVVPSSTCFTRAAASCANANRADAAAIAERAIASDEAVLVSSDASVFLSL